MLAASFSIGLWLIGHLSREVHVLGQQSDVESVSWTAGFVFEILPDFEVFNKTLEAVHGLPIAGSEVGLAVVYACGYTAGILALASIIFSRRDFR
jgi:ABC-type transport system involved in multi-copper enzyme maturation permease subunit